MVGEHNDITNQISDFIQGIRIQSEVRVPTLSGQVRNGNGPQAAGFTPHVQTARDEADKLILDAEQHKAAINSPPGRTDFVNFNNVPVSSQEGLILAPGIQYEQPTANLANGMGKFIEDDDFFPRVMSYRCGSKG